MPIIPISAGFQKWNNLLFRLKSKLVKKRVNRWQDVPIIINNFNRLTYLKQQVEWLEGVGLQNIHILDNNSNYPPLLEWYRNCKYPIYRLDKNVGHEAFWTTHIYQRFMHDFYVLTDPDVLPTQHTPHDFMPYFLDVLARHPEYTKVGFGLKIDDLPDHFPKKEEVLNWESTLNEKEVQPGLWKSKIDTTFALYRPGIMFQQWESTLRTSGAMELRHMPWYEDVNKLGDEDAFYYTSCNASSSWVNTVKGEDKRYQNK